MTYQNETFTISMLVENYAGVLSQITRLFSRRGYNIQSIAADQIDRPNETRITIIADGTDAMAEQILLQVRKQISVISAKIITAEASVQRSMVIIKVDGDTKEKRDEVIQISNVFRANIIDFSLDCLTISVTGAPDKIEAFIRLMTPFGILELVRSGIVTIERGKSTIDSEY